MVIPMVTPIAVELITFHDYILHKISSEVMEKTFKNLQISETHFKVVYTPYLQMFADVIIQLNRKNAAILKC